MSEQPQVIIDRKAIVVSVLDKTSPTVEIRPDATYVTVDASEKPVVTVLLGGGRGPIWLPGSYWDGTGLAAILSGAITKQQLSEDLRRVIDVNETGLIEARADLNAALNNFALTGELVDAVVTRLDIAEDAITNQVSRLNAAEANITHSQLMLDDKEIRLTVAEQYVNNHDNYILTQERMLKNEWTVKIQENADGSAYVAGTGLLVYPNWALMQIYDAGEYVWFDDHAYKSRITHTAEEANAPPNWTYWEYIPYATKSQFGVLAESFFVQTSAEGGHKAVPFVVMDGLVSINGDMIVNGLISAGALSAGQVFTWSIQSPNYSPGVSGYQLDATTGRAEFNNFDLVVNYNDLFNKPNTLGAIDSVSAAKLASMEAGATVGANWATNVYGRPADADILNSNINLSAFATVNLLNQNIANIQAQLDGQFTTWYYPGNPTLLNEPAVNWTTLELKEMHIGDLYYDELTGAVFRFKYDGGYLWLKQPNTDLSEALANAAKAQDTADNKRRVFVTTPSGPYDIGDLWVENELVKVAKVNRLSGYHSSEWAVTASYGALASEIAELKADSQAKADAAVIMSNYAALETWNYNNVENFEDTLGTWDPDWIEIIREGTELPDPVALTEDTPLLDPLHYLVEFVSNDLNINGAKYNRIRVRLHRTNGVGDWGMKVFYSTTNHGFHDDYCKIVPNSNVLDEWHTIEIDMANLDTGGTDWVESTVTGLRINMLTDNWVTYEIDWVVLGYVGVPDVTAENTAADTVKVAGTPAETVRANAIYANAAVVNMEADSVFSVAEKRQWQIQWPGMESNYTGVLGTAAAVGVSTVNLTAARNALYTFLNTTHGVFAAEPVNTPLTQGQLTALVADFYAKLQAAIETVSFAYTEAWSMEGADVTANSNFVTTVYPANNTAIQTQIDGKVESWFQSTDPAAAWSTASIKLLHSGDMWWNTSTNKLKRYNGVSWSADLTDQKAIDAFTNASTAQSTADGKMVVFTSTPTAPYDIGDLWSENNVIKTAIIARASTYYAADWVVSADTTSRNTSADTAKVAGTAAETIKNSAVYANAAVVNMEADSVFSVLEKQLWRVEWNGMEANYVSVKNAAALVSVSTISLIAARNNLFSFLDQSHNVFTNPLSNSALVVGALSDLVAAFYTALGNTVDATSQAAAKLKADLAQAAAINWSQTNTNNAINAADYAALINSKTTTISGGKITSGTILAGQIGANQISGDHIVAGSVHANRLIASSITAGQIASDTITTNIIKANNITVINTTSRYDAIYGAVGNIIECSITMLYAGKLIAIYNCGQGFPYGDKTWNANLVINGGGVISAGGQKTLDTVALSGSLSVGAGTHTVRVDANNSVSMSVNGRTLIVMGVMR